MQSTSYSIDAGSKIFSLSEKSWQVFSPFISRYQWAFDDPSFSPRKVEIGQAILNRGKKGCCTFFRPEGYTYKLPVLHPRHFEEAVHAHKIYYVSYGRQTLLYLDIDLHYVWQTLTHGHEAQALLGKLMPQVFWASSARGANGYMKVDLQGKDYERANKVFERLQIALRLYLAHHNNLADFEIKGTVGYMKDGQYQWGQYGKLPIHAKDWNFARVEEFEAKPTVRLCEIEFLCETIEENIPQQVLTQHEQHKKSLGDEPIRDGKWFLVTPAIEKMLLDNHGEGWRSMFEMLDDTWMHERYYRPGQAPLTELEWRKARAAMQAARVKPVIANPAPSPVTLPPINHRPRNDDQPRQSGRGPVNLDVSDLVNEPDSFKRQKDALLRYARYLRRVPTVEEALQLIHDHKLFSGHWNDNEAGRARRVHDILNFISLTFDPAKCANGHVNVGKYDEWARQKFPNGLIGGSRRYLTEHMEIVESEPNVRVNTKFIAVFMAVCEFALLIDKNQDGSLPHHRGQELWQELHARGATSVKFCPRKWAVCRDELARLGIVRIVDRDYHSGKAMKWDVGVFFPLLGLWKGKKHRGIGGGSLPRERRGTTREGHNTLLHLQSSESAGWSRERRSRPPPEVTLV